MFDLTVSVYSEPQNSDMGKLPIFCIRIYSGMVAKGRNTGINADKFQDTVPKDKGHNRPDGTKNTAAIISCVEFAVLFSL